MPRRLPLRFEQNPHSSPLSHAWLPAALPSCPPHCSPPWLALFLLPPGLSAFALAGPSDSKLSEAQPCCFHTVSWTDPRPPVSSLARPSPPLPGRGAKAAADALRCTEPRSVQLLHRRLQPLLLTAITDKRPRCLEVGKASWRILIFQGKGPRRSWVASRSALWALRTSTPHPDPVSLLGGTPHNHTGMRAHHLVLRWSATRRAARPLMWPCVLQGPCPGH